MQDAVGNVVVIGKATQVYAQQAVAGGVLVGQPMGAGGGARMSSPTIRCRRVEGLRNVLDRTRATRRRAVTLVTVKDDNSDLEAAKAAAAAADAVGHHGRHDRGGRRRPRHLRRRDRRDADGDRRRSRLVRGPAERVLDGDRESAREQQHRRDDQGHPRPRRRPTGKSMAAKTALVLKDNAGVAMDPALLGQAGPAILEAGSRDRRTDTSSPTCCSAW